MRKIVEFKVGTEFRYMGNSFPKEYNRTQRVLNILTINGEESVRSKFLDNDYIHIFEIRNNKHKSSYSYHCFPLDIELDNGIPMFWDEVDELK